MKNTSTEQCTCELYGHCNTCRRRNPHTVMLDTFGPNPCDRIRMWNRDTNDIFRVQCDSRRCQHCGPRKELLLQMGAQRAFSHQVMMYTAHSDAAFTQIRNALRQHRRRIGPAEYIAWWDDHLKQWHIITNVQLRSWRALGAVMKRTMDVLRDLTFWYSFGLRRIRKSHGTGSVTLSPKGSRKSVTRWARLNDDGSFAGFEDVDWDDLRDEIDYQNGNLYEYNPARDDESGVYGSLGGDPGPVQGALPAV